MSSNGLSKMHVTYLSILTGFPYLTIELLLELNVTVVPSFTFIVVLYRLTSRYPVSLFSWFVLKFFGSLSPLKMILTISCRKNFVVRDPGRITVVIIVFEPYLRHFGILRWFLTPFDFPTYYVTFVSSGFEYSDK